MTDLERVKCADDEVEITPVRNNSTLANRRSMFFSAGSNPVRKGNRKALREAMTHVWPVLLTWTHFHEDGDVHETTSQLSCAKTTTSRRQASDAPGTDELLACVAPIVLPVLLLSWFLWNL